MSADTPADSVLNVIFEKNTSQIKVMAQNSNNKELYIYKDKSLLKSITLSINSSLLAHGIWGVFVLDENHEIKNIFPDGEIKLEDKLKATCDLKSSEILHLNVFKLCDKLAVKKDTELIEFDVPNLEDYYDYQYSSSYPVISMVKTDTGFHTIDMRTGEMNLIVDSSYELAGRLQYSTQGVYSDTLGVCFCKEK
ncbi:MAG: hypothetical protein R2883_01600 [Caldisericia bacterium]